jgi:hypothetical protein
MENGGCTMEAVNIILVWQQRPNRSAGNCYLFSSAHFFTFPHSKVY